MVHERLLAIAARCQKGGAGGTAARFPLLAQRIETLVAEQLAPLAHNCKAKVCVVCCCREFKDSRTRTPHTPSLSLFQLQASFFLFSLALCVRGVCAHAHR